MAPRLKMSPPLVHILLSLVPGPRHGYAILQEIGERTSGRVRLGPSSLYWSLGRLEDAGLIEESPQPDDEASQDERRRYWGLTGQGREGLRQELENLEDILSNAHARELMSRGR